MIGMPPVPLFGGGWVRAGLRCIRPGGVFSPAGFLSSRIPALWGKPTTGRSSPLGFTLIAVSALGVSSVAVGHRQGF